MTLKAINEEDITVSTAAIGPSSGSAFGNEVDLATFQLRSGGKIHGNPFSAPTAAGGAGDVEYLQGQSWWIRGHDNIKAFNMIKQTGEADATVSVIYWGTGRT